MESRVDVGTCYIKQRMKILLINDDFGGIGGEKTYINNLREDLSRVGHTIFSLYLSRDQSIESENIKVLKHVYKNKLQRFMSTNLIDYSLYREMRSYILKVNPDIIHLNNTYNASKTILLACRGFKKIQTVHDFGFICPLCSFKKRNLHFICDVGQSRSIKCYMNSDIKFRTYLLDYLLFNDSWIKKKVVSLFVCPSPKLFEVTIANGYKNAICLPCYTTFKPRCAQGNSNNVLFVGRLSAEKGVDVLLKAFKIVVVEDNTIRLHVIGSGPDEKKLRSLAKKLFIEENVTFIGEVKSNKLGKYYKDSFTLVVPSLWQENSPLVVYEAMSFGLPIIASNIGGLPGLIKDGKNGFLVERFDFKQIAEKIILLHNDKALAKKMGEINVRIVKNKLGQENHVKNILKIYKSVIQ